MANTESRPATRQEVEALRTEAIKQLSDLGLSTGDNAVKSTLNRLMRERGLEYPNSRRQRRPAAAPHSTSNSSKTAERSAHGVQCKETPPCPERKGKEKRWPMGFFFISLPEVYVTKVAVLVSNTKATVVLVCLLYYAQRDGETWVGQEALRSLSGLSTNTIRKAVRRLDTLGIVTVKQVRPGMRAKNGKIIRKRRGHLYQLNPPEQWDWVFIERLRNDRLQNQ